MNNKGFMMAEVVVVSSIIIVTLVALYTSYNKIISVYNQRVDYYDVTTLYELADIRDNVSLIGVSSQETINHEGKEAYYLKNTDLSELTQKVTNQTYKDYLEYISGSVTFETEFILVRERCIDADNCKYAYLEVYN